MKSRQITFTGDPEGTMVLWQPLNTQGPMISLMSKLHRGV